MKFYLIPAIISLLALVNNWRSPSKPYDSATQYAEAIDMYNARIDRVAQLLDAAKSNTDRLEKMVMAKASPKVAYLAAELIHHDHRLNDYRSQLPAPKRLSIAESRSRNAEPATKKDRVRVRQENQSLDADFEKLDQLYKKVDQAVTQIRNEQSKLEIELKYL